MKVTRLSVGALAVALAGVMTPLPTIASEQPVLLDRCDGVPGARCGAVPRPLDPNDPALRTVQVGFELHTPRGSAASSTAVRSRRRSRRP